MQANSIKIHGYTPGKNDAGAAENLGFYDVKIKTSDLGGAAANAFRRRMALQEGGSRQSTLPA